MNLYHLDFAFAQGEPEQSARFRVSQADFVVDERLEPELSGSGEHLWLRITKRGENTDWVAGKLARHFGVRKGDIGYAGKKDRHAITTQWFSVYLPGREHEPDWQKFIEESELDATLERWGTGNRKLRMGDHSANAFCIRLRDVQQDEALLKRLEGVAREGVPNYFGKQRFGRDGGNLEKVQRWMVDPRAFRDRSLRGMIISSARSYLFNRVLSARVEAGNWTEGLSGEPAPEFGSTGPLWGRGRSLATDALLALESAVLEPYASCCAALENVGLQQERRALNLQPRNFSWAFDGEDMELQFELDPGQFATSVLREIVLLEEQQHELSGAKHNRG